MKNKLKPGFMALGLAMMLAPLGQAQTQWSGEQEMTGYGVNNPALAQIPGTNILQLFYQGQDGGLWTQWRNTNGTWSSQQGLGAQLNSSASPTAVQLPGTNILQVFYRGQDNALWTLWRNPDGSWSNMQSLGGQLSGDAQRRSYRARISSRSFTGARTTPCGLFGGTRTEAGLICRVWGDNSAAMPQRRSYRARIQSRFFTRARTTACIPVG
jgi:hypothetical protein